MVRQVVRILAIDQAVFHARICCSFPRQSGHFPAIAATLQGKIFSGIRWFENLIILFFMLMFVMVSTFYFVCFRESTRLLQQVMRYNPEVVVFVLV